MDPTKALDSLREKIVAGNRGGTEAEQDILLMLSDRLALLSSKYSEHRRLKLLRHNCRIAENADCRLDAVPTDREAAEDAVTWVNRTYDNPETNRDYRSALRVFAKRVTEGTDVPDAVDWVPTSTPSSYDPSPNPAEMLRWEADIKPMLNAATNARDAALVAMAFDSGCRSGELRDVAVGDVAEAEHGLRLRVDGKTGERSVTLVPSEPYIAKWLGEHPASGDPTASLWTTLGELNELSYRRFRDIFDEVADRAGVEKPTTPTQFRKSNASWLARQGANAALIEDRQGRARNSEAVARYVSRFGEEDEARQIAQLHGMEVEESSDEELAPIECRRCGKETPHDEEMCVWCGAATDPVAAEAADQVRSTLRESMARSDDPEKRAALLSALSELDNNPEAAAQLVTEIADGDIDIAGSGHGEPS